MSELPAIALFGFIITGAGSKEYPIGTSYKLGPLYVAQVSSRLTGCFVQCVGF